MKNLIFKLKFLEKVIVLKPKPENHFSLSIKIRHKYTERKKFHNFYFPAIVFRLKQ